MIEVEQAALLLQQAIAPQQKSEEVEILAARGRVTAADIRAPLAVPQFAKSAMDGYALRSEDAAEASRKTPVRLRVLGEVYAGDAPAFAAAPGTAVRIMTGGAVPDGYDCVLKQEDSDCGEETVAVYKAVQPQENYCAVGEDLLEGQLAIPANTRLGSRHIGILASMGFAHVRVLCPLRVGLIATGDELVHPGAALGAAQVYNNSSYTIASHLAAAGVQLAFLEICKDDAAQLCRMVAQRADEFDVLITTGGVSVGKRDIVPDAMELLGAQRIFHRVNMKPGTPVLAARYGEKVALCLSGNPFAALVNFHVFFWPMLASAMRNESFGWRRERAVLCEGAMKPSGLRRFVRAHKKQDGVYIYTQNHRSSVLSNLAASNCIIDQPAGQPLAVGDVVEILYWEH